MFKNILTTVNLWNFEIAKKKKKTPKTVISIPMNINIGILAYSLLVVDLLKLKYY